MDIEILFNGNNQSGDINVANGDLTTDDTIVPAVLLSLFCDRLADPSDLIPDGTTWRRGWWGDLLSEVDGDLTGSRLWILRRKKLTEETLNKARDYAVEALQWLIDDGIAQKVDVVSEKIDYQTLGLQVIITRRALPDYAVQYNLVW